MILIRLFLISCMIFISVSVFSQDMPVEIPDDPHQIFEVWMKDKQLYEGKVELLDKGKILLKSSQFGDVVVSILDIQSIKPLLRIDYERKPLFTGRKKVILKDGTEIVGKATQQRRNQFVLLTENGDRYLLGYDDIEEVKELKYLPSMDREVNTNYANYLYTPSGYTIAKGQVNFHNANLYYNALEFGVFDWLSMSLGADVGFLNYIRKYRPLKDKSFFFGSLKASYQASDKWNVAIGSYFSRPNAYWDLLPDSTSVTPFIVNTFGSKVTNVSLGLALPRKQVFSQRIIYSFSGMARVMDRFALISDNWLKPVTFDSFDVDTGISKRVSRYEPHLSVGVRYLGKKLSIDIAGVYRNVGPFGTGQLYRARELELGVFFGLKYQIR